MKKGYVQNWELTFKKKDGSPVHVRGSATIHRDDEGNILRTEGIFFDITEQRRLEELLRESERTIEAS